jgi:sodium pump decarboxylase gamma subunit
MTFGALAIRENGTYVPFSADAWSYAGQMTLLGIGMVFAVLAILWAVLGIFKLVFAGSQPKQAKPEKKPEVKAEKAPTAPVTAPAPVAQSSDAELVAIITAAVAAYMAEEGTEYAGGFRVVSFKRVRGGRTWNSK